MMSITVLAVFRMLLFLSLDLIVIGYVPTIFAFGFLIVSKMRQFLSSLSYIEP